MLSLFRIFLRIQEAACVKAHGREESGRLVRPNATWCGRSPVGQGHTGDMVGNLWGQTRQKVPWGILSSSRLEEEPSGTKRGMHRRRPDRELESPGLSSAPGCTTLSVAPGGPEVAFAILVWLWPTPAASSLTCPCSGCYASACQALGWVVLGLARPPPLLHLVTYLL